MFKALRRIFAKKPSPGLRFVGKNISFREAVFEAAPCKRSVYYRSQWFQVSFPYLYFVISYNSILGVHFFRSLYVFASEERLADQSHPVQPLQLDRTINPWRHDVRNAAKVCMGEFRWVYFSFYDMARAVISHYWSSEFGHINFAVLDSGKPIMDFRPTPLLHLMRVDKITDLGGRYVS